MQSQNQSLFSAKILVALAVYITSLVAANTLGIKLMPFLFETHLSVAVFSFPVVFLMTDIVGEVYGKSMARAFVWAGFISTILWLVYIFLSIATPWDAKALWAKEGYETVFSTSFRFAIASVAAFIIAEYQDVVAFFFFKKKWGEKKFWLRSNLSNIWSQLLDTVIFTTIAYIGIYDFPTLVNIIIPWWLYKVIMGFFYTPLSYLGIRLLRGKAK